MCFPGAPIAAGAGLQVLGNAALGRQQADAVNRRNTALEAETARQAPIKADAAATFDRALATVTAPDSGAIEKDRMAALSAVLDDPTSDGTMAGGSQNRVVKTAVAKAMNAAIRDGHANARAMAKMGAHSDRAFSNSLALRDSGSDLGMLAQNAGNSANILPVELAAANQAFDPTFGDALRGAGDLSIAYGITDPFNTAANRVVKGPLASKNFLGAIS